MSNKQKQYTNEKNKIMTSIDNKKEGMITQSIIDELKIKITEYNKILKVLNSNKENLMTKQYTITYNESKLMKDIKSYTDEINKLKKDIQKNISATDKIIKEKKILELQKNIYSCEFLIHKQKQEDMERKKEFMKLETEISETELKLNEMIEKKSNYEMGNAGIDYGVKTDTIKLNELNTAEVKDEKNSIQSKYNEVNNNIKKEKTNYDNKNKNSNISKNNERITKLTNEIKKDESSKTYLFNKINKVKEISNISSDLTKIGDVQKRLESIKKESFTPIERFDTSKVSTQFTKDVTSMITYCNEIINNTKTIDSIVNEQNFNNEIMERARSRIVVPAYDTTADRNAWPKAYNYSVRKGVKFDDIMNKGIIDSASKPYPLLYDTLKSYKSVLDKNVKNNFKLTDKNKIELYKKYWKEMKFTDYLKSAQWIDNINRHMAYQLAHWRTLVPPYTILQELYNDIALNSWGLTNKLNTCKNNIIKYSKQLQTTLINMLTYMQTSINDINSVISSNQQTISDLKLQIVNKQAELEKAKEMITNLQTQLSDLQKQLNSKQAELKICEEQLSLAKKNEAEALTNYNKAVSKHDVAKRDYENAVKNYNDTKKEYDNIEAECAELVIEENEISEAIAKIEAEIALKDVEKDKTEIEKLEKDKRDYEKQQQELKDRFNKLDSEYVRLEEQLTQYEQTKNDLNAKLMYSEEEVKLMYDKYIEQSEERKRLEKQQSILVKNINNIKEQIADCKKSLNEEIAKKEEAEKAVADYKEALKLANDNIIEANRIKQELQYQLEYNQQLQYEEENKRNMSDKKNREMIYDLDTKNKQLEDELEEANKRLQYALTNPVVQYIESEPTIQYVERIIEKIVYKEREPVVPDISDSIIKEAIENIKDAENTTYIYDDEQYYDTPYYGTQYENTQYYDTQYGEEQYNSSSFTPTVITLMVIMILGIISSVMSSMVLIYYKTKNISITSSLISTCVSATISVAFGVAFGVVKSKT